MKSALFLLILNLEFKCRIRGAFKKAAYFMTSRESKEQNTGFK